VTPAGPYSPAVSDGGFIYVSGTVARGEDGAIASPGDVSAQTRIVLERLSATLAAAGSSLEQVVSATVYLRTAGDFQAMNAVYRTFWAAEPPTRTTVIAELVAADALIEIAMIAVPAGAERVVVHPAAWAKSPSPYSYAIRSGDTVFLSGLVPRDLRDNSARAGDVTEQTRHVIANAAELLNAAGLSLSDIVAARVYLTDAALFPGMNQAYREAFPNGYPSRATVKAGLAGPDFVVEITFTATAGARAIVGSPPAGVPISPAIKAGGRVYLSGALGNTRETAGDVAAQTRLTLARLSATLGAAGVSPADVVDSTVYLKDARSLAAVNEPYREFFGGSFPARTTIGTPLVADDGLVEILFTAIAR
jgi:2-iminobutanoate/2-iminopropanoate deaminase